MIFCLHARHLARRYVPITQLARRQMSPHIDIDAMVVGNAEQLLCPACHRTKALGGWIDQVEAGHVRRAGAGNPVNGTRLLGLLQPRLKTAIIACRRGGHWPAARLSMTGRGLRQHCHLRCHVRRKRGLQGIRYPSGNCAYRRLVHRHPRRQRQRFCRQGRGGWRAVKQAQAQWLAATRWLALPATPITCRVQHKQQHEPMQQDHAPQDGAALQSFMQGFAAIHRSG